MESKYYLRTEKLQLSLTGVVHIKCHIFNITLSHLIQKSLLVHEVNLLLDIGIKNMTKMTDVHARQCQNISFALFKVHHLYQ